MMPSALPNKLVPPQLGGLVSRGRLFRTIEQAPPRGVVWISAPPGAGKSSLAATWLYSGGTAARHGHALWYRIDETDADPIVFFEFLALALAHLPDPPRGVLPKLTPEALLELPVFVRSGFKLLLQGTARAPYLFAFDDVHRLPPDSPIVEVLAVLAGTLGARDRMLCLSRQDPPDRIRAAVPKARFVHLADLRVEVDEWEDFGRDVPAAGDVTRTTFADRLRRSGHWISDLVLAASPHPSLQDLSVHPFRVTERFLDGYNAAERTALLATAFLQIGQDEDWQALGGNDAVAILIRLADESTLVTRLINGALGKHDLFFEQLRTTAEAELTSEALAAARLKAGRLMAGRGEMLPGGRLLFQAGAGNEIRDLVIGRAAEMIAAGKNRELLALIAMLPDEARALPLVRIWQAAGRLPFEPVAAREAYHDVWRAADPAAQPLEFALAIMGEINAALADWSIDRRLEALIAEIDRATPFLTNLPEAVRERLTMTRAVAMLLGCPSHPGVLDAQRQAEAALPSLPPDRRLLVGAILLSYLLWWRGDLAAARPYLSSLEPLASRPNVPPLATMTWYYGALSIAYRDGDIDAVRRLLAEVIAFAQKWGTQHRLVNAYWVAAQAYAAAGDRAGVDAALAGCVESARRAGRPDFVGAHFLRAALALGSGNADLAIGEALPGYDRAGRFGDTQQLGLLGLVLAMAFAVKADDGARVYIDELRDLATRSHSAIFRLHADLAEACLAAAQGRMPAFVASWNGMAHFACQLGFRCMSGANAAYLADLANEALRHGGEIDVTRRLIALWDLPAPRRAPPHDLWPYRVEIACLGGFSIAIEGHRITTGQGKAQRKPRELLWHLVMANGRNLGQDWLADQLWPEADGDQAQHSLTMTVYRLRKLIGADAVILEDSHIWLNPQRVSTDLGRLHATLRLIQDEALPVADRMAAFDRALQLYQGPLLPGVTLAPVILERERLSALLAGEGLGLLLTLGPDELGRTLRLNRLRSAIGDTALPSHIARLWPA